MGDIPTVVGPIRAWRWFRVMPDGALRALIVDTMYHADREIPPAVCDNAAEHAAPQLSCTCGYYAFKDFKDCIQYRMGLALGAVSLWGRVVEHERGWRAERMSIDAIWLVPAFDKCISDRIERSAALFGDRFMGYMKIRVERTSNDRNW